MADGHASAEGNLFCGLVHASTLLFASRFRGIYLVDTICTLILLYAEEALLAFSKENITCRIGSAPICKTNVLLFHVSF